eukprot:GHVT01050901.1.p2 GENE.GHVT01050901.1~~GHVT01050901.1.p2  ORF type:complete len:114 (-),score=3.05 GHVT01050901.1:1061-1402(-)
MSDAMPPLKMNYSEIQEETQTMDILMFTLSETQVKKHLQLYIHGATTKFWREDFAKLPSHQQTHMTRAAFRSTSPPLRSQAVYRNANRGWKGSRPNYAPPRPTPSPPTFSRGP